MSARRSSGRARAAPKAFHDEAAKELEEHERKLKEKRAAAKARAQAKAKADAAEKKRLAAERKRKNTAAKPKKSSPKRARVANGTAKSLPVANAVVLAAPPVFDPVELAKERSRLPNDDTLVWSAEGPRRVVTAAGQGAAGRGLVRVDSSCPLDGDPVHTLLHDGEVRRLAWSSEGDMLATCSDCGTIRVWEVPVGSTGAWDDDARGAVPVNGEWELLVELCDPLGLPWLDEYCACVFAPGDRYVFAAGKMSSREHWSERDGANRVLPGPIRVYDLTTGEVVSYLWGHAEEVWDITLVTANLIPGVSAPQNYCISCGEDGRVIRWALKDDWSGLRDGAQSRVGAASQSIEPATTNVESALGSATLVDETPRASEERRDAPSRVLPPNSELTNGASALRFATSQVSARQDIGFVDDDTCCSVYSVRILPGSANQYVLCAVDDGLRLFGLVFREDDPANRAMVVPLPRRWGAASFPSLHETQCDDLAVIHGAAADRLYAEYAAGKQPRWTDPPGGLTTAASVTTVAAKVTGGDVKMEDPVPSTTNDNPMNGAAPPASFTPIPRENVCFVVTRGIEALDMEGFLADATSSRLLLSRIELPTTKGGPFRRIQVRALKHPDYTPTWPLARISVGGSGLVVAPTNNLGAVFLWSVLSDTCAQVIQLGEQSEPLVQASLLHPHFPLLVCSRSLQVGSRVAVIVPRDERQQCRDAAERRLASTTSTAQLEEDARLAARLASQWDSSGDEGDAALTEDRTNDGFDFDAEVAAALAGD